MGCVNGLVSSLKFWKLMGKVYAVWPPDKSDKIYLHVLHNLLWSFYCLNDVVASCITLHTCYRGRDDFTIATFSWMEFVSIVEATVCLINYRCNKKLFEDVLNELEEYFENVDDRKKSFLKEKASTYAVLITLITLLYSILIVLYFSNPAVTHWDSLLTTAYYPPSIRSPLVNVMLYLHQIVVMCHTSVMVNVDALAVLLVYSCTVRLRILDEDLRQVEAAENLKETIREHQGILRLVEKTNLAVRAVTSKTVMAFISYTVGAGLQIINPKATAASLHRFGVVLLINVVRLIMIATSAGDLTRASIKISYSAYSTTWYRQKDREIVSNVRTVMLRSQKCLKIYVAGIMPELSLSFVTGVISTSISYFTTLRAVTSDMSGNSNANKENIG